MTERIASKDDTDAAGVVLAGGESSRMGRDKALLHFAGRPLIEYALATLHEAGVPAVIAGASPAAESDLAAYAPILRDAQPGLGPLAGICAALQAASTRFVVFLPIDLPLLPPTLVKYLLHHARITGRAVTVPIGQRLRPNFPRSPRPIRASGAPNRTAMRQTRLLFRFQGCRGMPRPARRRSCCRDAGSIGPGRASFWPATASLVSQRKHTSRSSAGRGAMASGHRVS